MLYVCVYFKHNNAYFNLITFQIIWNDSTLLGMGRASVIRNGMKCVYVVGRYKEKGNSVGLFHKNVFKGQFTLDKCKHLDQIIRERCKTYITNAAGLLKTGGSKIHAISKGYAGQMETRLML